jgi:transcriptional regulator of arginine metabolism
MEVIKRLRQQQIREIIERGQIRTQGELAAALRERGFRATQATVSRDVAELGLAKLVRDGVRAYAFPPSPQPAAGAPGAEPTAEERLAAVLYELPIELRAAGTLLVLRAVPGSAHAIAAALDRARWGEVIGSIGGDDTVFIACADRRAVARVEARLRRLTGGG